MFSINSTMLSLFALTFITYFSLNSCRGSRPAYKYNLVQIAIQNDGKTIESPPSSFVCLDGNIFEYEIREVQHTEFDAQNKEISRITSYDTLGLYLLKPKTEKYFKIFSKDTLPYYLDSGRIDQKDFGVSFKNDPLKPDEFVNTNNCRDTVIDNVELKMYEKLDINKVNYDTTQLRYFFFRDLSVNSILTYIPSVRFSQERDIYRIDVNSRKQGVYIVTIRDLNKLSKKEVTAFRKLIPVGTNQNRY